MAEDFIPLDVDALLEAPLRQAQQKEREEATEEQTSQTAVDDDQRTPSRTSRKRSSRSRSRDRHSRSGSHRSSRASRSPRRSPPRSYRHGGGRDRHYRHYRDRQHEDRGPAGRRERDKEPAEETPEDEERDARTVFASNMHIRATDKELREFFGKVGEVRDVRLIMDRPTGKSKGFGYIEYYDQSAAQAALALSGSLLKGQPVHVQPSNAEKNKVATSSGGGSYTASSSSSSAALNVAGAIRLSVGNLHPFMREEDVKAIFEPFGPLSYVNLQKDAQGQSQGIAYLQFKDAEDAKVAVQHTNRLQVAGRMLEVGFIAESRTPGFIGDLDEDESGGGLGLNAQGRSLLMQKLSTRAGLTSPATTTSSFSSSFSSSSSMMPTIPQLPTMHMPAMSMPVATVTPAVGALPTPSPVPTTCLLLKNMFDPATETAPDYDQEIQEDVGEECSKFGKVKHVRVVKDSPEGLVYVKMETVEAAMKAQQALNHRWFAGKMISVDYIVESAYNQENRL
ncbi:RNA-binding protein 39 [Balamuthia mandrillaris]